LSLHDALPILTVGCARCHDHKFDPVTQKDFYRLYAFFNSNDEAGEDGRVGNAAPIMAAPTAEQQAKMKQERQKIEGAERRMAEIEGRTSNSELQTPERLQASTSNEGGSETNLILVL